MDWKNPLEAKWSNLLFKAGPIEQVARTSPSHVLNISVDGDFTASGVPAPNHLVGCTRLNSVHPCLFVCRGPQHLSQHSRRALTDTKEMRRITLLDLLAKFLPTCLCQLMLNLLSTWATSTFPAKLFPFQSVPGSALLRGVFPLLEQDVAFAFVGLHDFLQLIKVL